MDHTGSAILLTVPTDGFGPRYQGASPMFTRRNPIVHLILSWIVTAPTLGVRCDAQTLRDRLLHIQPTAPGEPKAFEEIAVRELVNASSLPLEVPILIAAIDGDQAFAPGTHAREWAFICLTSTGDRHGAFTITDATHLQRVIRAAQEEPIETRKRAVKALRLAAPNLLPIVNEAITSLLKDPDPAVVYAVLDLIFARRVEPEPFVDAMRAVAEHPEQVIPRAWENIIRQEHENSLNGRFPLRGNERKSIQLRESAAWIVIAKGDALDNDVVRIVGADADTRLAYALAFASYMNLADGPVYAASESTQHAIATLVGAAAVEYDKQVVTGNERGRGLRKFLNSEAVSPDARRALAFALATVANKIEHRILAGEIHNPKYDTWLVGELRAWAAGAP